MGRNINYEAPSISNMWAGLKYRKAQLHGPNSNKKVTDSGPFEFPKD